MVGASAFLDEALVGAMVGCGTELELRVSEDEFGVSLVLIGAVEVNKFAR